MLYIKLMFLILHTLMCVQLIVLVELVVLVQSCIYKRKQTVNWKQVLDKHKPRLIKDIRKFAGKEMGTSWCKTRYPLVWIHLVQGFYVS